MTDLTRETFCLDLIRDVSGVLEDTVGLDEAEGYLAVVGLMMGDRIYARYGYGPTQPLPPADLPDILIDLKRRIGGTFELESINEHVAVFINGQCPYGARVDGRPSLCMMTSNVFGAIAAQSHGYAKVELQKTIANGDGMCRVAVHFAKTDADGREYYSRADATV